MVDEQRRWNWMDKAERPPMYEYVQKRIVERVKEDKYMGLILPASENKELKQAIEAENAKRKAASEPETMNQ